jgi:hypothetical protein
MTSITMNGGTSLRTDGTISRFAASSIDSTVRYRPTGRPAVAAFGRFAACYKITRLWGDCAVSICRARCNGLDPYGSIHGSIHMGCVQRADMQTKAC